MGFFEDDDKMYFLWGIGVISAAVFLALLWFFFFNPNNNTLEVYDYKTDNQSAAYCLATLYLKEASDTPSNYSCSWIAFMIKRKVYPESLQEFYFCKECPSCSERWQQTITLSQASINKRFQEYYKSEC